MYEKPAGIKSIDIKEVGPRFELRLYQVHYQLLDTLIFILMQILSVMRFKFFEGVRVI